MMMATPKQQHLHELLREDQEPFQLHNYIADRRCQLKRPNTSIISSLQPKKLHKPIIDSSSSKRILCRKACFYSFLDSPVDVRKSPFLSPMKGTSSSGAVFLHIPAKTASLLLEAAMKIQKQSSKPKTHGKNIGFGLFGSILKRLKDKNKFRKREIRQSATTISLVRDDPPVEKRKSTTKREKLEEITEHMIEDEKIFNYEMVFSGNNSRLSSAGWSESNEGKSLDMETSCSTSRSDYTEEIDFATCDQKHFCSSPLSPFRFVLQRSPSGAVCTDLLSPATSPTRHKAEERDHHIEEVDLQKTQLQEEEEKDQCSPVSVLDPLFEDDERNDGDDDEDEDYDLECSYAIMQRAKVQLLHKLQRFERLAELDPVELEKRMLEDQEEEGTVEEDECSYVYESQPLHYEEDINEFVKQVLKTSNLCNLIKTPADVKRLVLDLINEERKIGSDCSNVVMISRVCKRLDSWKEVESNTIDMMVELDLRKEHDGWMRYQEEAEEKAREIELAIFGLLLEELIS